MSENRTRPENWMALVALALAAAALCGCGKAEPKPPPGGQAVTAKAPSADAADWPTQDTQFPWIAEAVVRVIRATATEEAVLGERSATHRSTRMKLGDGETIEGGGNVYCAKCRQKFRVAEAIKGAAEPKEFVLNYGIVEKSECFPGPSAQKPIPANAPVILLLGEKDALLKALPDTPENLKAVREALSAGAPAQPKPAVAGQAIPAESVHFTYVIERDDKEKRGGLYALWLPLGAEYSYRQLFQAVADGKVPDKRMTQLCVGLPITLVGRLEGMVDGDDFCQAESGTIAGDKITIPVKYVCFRGSRRKSPSPHGIYVIVSLPPLPAGKYRATISFKDYVWQDNREDIAPAKRSEAVPHFVPLICEFEVVAAAKAELTEPQARELAAKLANEAFAKAKLVGVGGKPVAPGSMRPESWRVAELKAGRWELELHPPAGHWARVSFKADGSDPKVEVGYEWE